MQVIALNPRRSQIIAQLMGLGLCTIGMLIMPSMCLPLALIMPLFACPLVGLNQQWATLVAPAVPCVLSLAYGSAHLYALSLFMIVAVPIAFSYWLVTKNLDGKQIASYYLITAYLLGLIGLLCALANMFDGSITEGLCDLLISSLQVSGNVGGTLRQLALYGLVSIPDDYKNALPLTFLMDQQLIAQMLMSLRLTLSTIVQKLLPELLIQICVIGGVFSALRAQRLKHNYLLLGRPDGDGRSEPLNMSIRSGFRMLELPEGCRTAAWLGTAVGFLLKTTAGGIVGWFGSTLFAACKSLFQLIGAAVIMGRLCARKEEYATLFGFLAAILYGLFPTALFLIGLIDPLVHFRKAKLKEDDSE